MKESVLEPQPQTLKFPEVRGNLQKSGLIPWAGGELPILKGMQEG